MNNYPDRFFYLLLTLVTATIISCTSKPDLESAIARAGDNYLYKEDIEGLVLPGTSVADSQVIVTNFINNWIKQQIMVQLAEDNLANEDKDFERQLDEYRNSLLIYAYETSFINQKLDTIVSEKEIEDYYNNHQREFELKNNIARVVFVKFNADSIDKRLIPRLKKYIKSDQPRDKDSLDAIAFRVANDFFLEADNWMTFENLQNLIPLTTYNQESFLSNNSYFEINNKPFLYLVRIFEYKMKESISPLANEFNNVRDIIVKKRKLEMLEKLRNDVFQKALRDKKFEIYKK